MKTHKIYLIAFLIITALFSCNQNISDSDSTQSQSYIGGLDENDKKQFTEKDVTVDCGQNGNTVKLRFYEDMGDVPYISVADYHKMMTGKDMSVKKTNYGEYKLTNSHGEAVINTKNETFFSNDYLSFTNIMDLYEPGMPNIGIDGLPYCRLKNVTLEPETAPVTLNYADCSIDLRGDDENVYFPFTSINDLYANLEFFRACYNGEKIIVISNVFNSDPEGIDPDYYKPIVSKETRTKEMAEFNYNNLCFIFKNYYGYPGSEGLKKMKELGFDGALLDLGEDGELIKRLLLSTDMIEYAVGLQFLNYYISLDKHSLTIANACINYDPAIKSKITELRDKTYTDGIKEAYQVRYEAFQNNYWHIIDGNMPRRAEVYDNSPDYYQTKGDTAVCLIGAFTARGKEFENYNAWKAFYAGTGAKPTLEEYPDDPALILFDSLERASEDPNIKNFVVDVSLNIGGFTDNVAFFTSLIMNKAEFVMKNTLTGQKITILYEVDRNLDGKFDASDDKVKYNFNFAVLESSYSYSCPNLFSSIMKDEGYAVLGEKSGGGVCWAQRMQSAEGITYQISSGKAFLLNKAGESIEPGIVPTNPIELGPNVSVTIDKETIEIPDYSNFWNIDLISSKVNEFYKNKQ
ncbi:MAG: hypothetical protein J6W76_02655 [Spirochaetales bacterium]|nr:hypothetical protein [Spirochaetales bacterium]